MMNCKEVARLVSEMKDHDVPWPKRMEVRFHLFMCKMCRAYHAQLDLISKLSKRAGDLVMSRSGESPSMSTAAKQRIKDRLVKPE